MIDVRHYITLEESLSRRLQRSWAPKAAKLYGEIASLITAGQWADAYDKAKEVDFSDIGERNQGYVRYVLWELALFGARMTGNDKPLLGVADIKNVVDPTVKNLLLALEWNATAYTYNALVQSIARAQQASLEGTVLKNNPYHDPDDGRFTTADGSGTGDPGPAEKAGRLELTDMEGVDPGIQARIRKVAEDLLADYPMVEKFKIGGWDDDHSLAIATGAGMLISNKHWNAKRLAEYQKEWDGLQVDPSPEGIVTHEFGHFLAKQADKTNGGKNFKKVRLGMKEMHESDMQYKPPSVYGQENDSEFQAEAFVVTRAVRKGKTLTHFNKDWAAECISNSNKVTEFIESFLLPKKKK